MSLKARVAKLEKELASETDRTAEPTIYIIYRDAEGNALASAPDGPEVIAEAEAAIAAGAHSRIFTIAELYADAETFPNNADQTTIEAKLNGADYKRLLNSITGKYPEIATVEFITLWGGNGIKDAS